MAKLHYSFVTMALHFYEILIFTGNNIRHITIRGEHFPDRAALFKKTGEYGN